VVVGLGLLGLALISGAMIWFVLAGLAYLERRLKPASPPERARAG